MKTAFRLLAALALALFALPARAAADATTAPTPNLGFEDGHQGWAFNDDVSTVAAEAAHTGAQGLRVALAEPRPTGSSVMGGKFPVTPGQEITLSFWARAPKPMGAVYVYFYDAAGKILPDPQTKGRGPRLRAVDQADGNWHEYNLKVQIPERAAHLALWLHAWSSTTGTMDFDDFALAGLAPDAVPIPPVQRPRPPPPPKPEEIPPRKVPPVIILKFDDVKQFKGMVFPCWTKLAEYLQSRQIKGSFGVICQSLEEATPEYVEWIKRWRDSGLVEFWFHGWDHATHEVDGVRYNEFNKRPYAEQKERFDKAQRLAQEKLGFAFETFGPTGGVGNGLFDENTVKVMADDPHLKAWLYPQPLDKAGQELEAAGKVTILDRVWAVNLEAGVGAPDFNRFLAGYAQNLTRDYFVLQGHPAAWDDNRFAEFARILDFLVAQKAVFMTPMEFVNSRKGGAGK